MQATKDTFYMTLRARLAQVNAARTAVIGGVSRPAVMPTENERPGEADELTETFVLEWGSPKPVEAGGRLCCMQCTVSYESAGTEAQAGMDRGRRLGAMDMELAAICYPQRADKYDYTQTPEASLGTSLFWSEPVFKDAEFGTRTIKRKAVMTVYYLPEAAA